MDWIQLAQGADQWRDLVNKKKNIGIQRKTWDFWSNCDTTSFQESSCSLLHVKLRLAASDFSKCQLNCCTAVQIAAAVSCCCSVSRQ